MKNNTTVYVLMLTNNDLEKIDKTIESVLSQTMEKKHIRLVAIDNASTDGTYEKLLKYEIQYPKIISVMRETQKTTNGRLLKLLLEYLQHTIIDYSMCIFPGDVLYPDFLEQSVQYMKLKKDAKVLIAETDILQDNKIIEQTPIYTENCLLREGLSRKTFYTAGIGHKINALFKGTILETKIKLPYYAQIVEFHEWYSMSYFVNYNCIYLKKKSGYIFSEKSEDVIRILMNRAFFMKRGFYAVETNVFSTLRAESIEVEEVKAGYRCLAFMALQYAIDALRDHRKEIAKQCLIYAEMMDLEIIKEEGYNQIKRGLTESVAIETMQELMNQGSEEPPWESPVF